MSLCINPHCQKQQNPDDILFCQGCGSELLLQGRYRVMHQLGGGGFGLTFEVNELRSNTLKVLKVLTNNLPKAVELFQQEAHVLSHLNHPGIPKVERDGYFVYHPRDSQEPIHCLVMEKVVGMDLEKYMKNREMRPIDQTWAMEWLRELVSILHQVHSQNFFHRDIKPPNIMLRADGRLALIDFGTARAITQTYWFAQAQGGVTGISSAGYTPTEQMNNRAVPQSDFFALGRTFVYLLTGKEPTDPAVYDSYNNELGWRNFAAQISPQFADLIDSMMAHLPSQRPANTEEILQRLAEIEQVLNRPPTVNYFGVPPTQPMRTPPPVPVNNPVVPSTKAVNTPPVSVPPSAVAQGINFGRGFWFKWVLASAVGTAMGVFAWSFLVRGFLSLPFIVVGAVAGTIVGIMQGLVLRQNSYRVGWWVVATAIGAGVSFFFFAATALISVFNVVLFTLFSAVVWTTVGTMQWLVLRRRVSRAGWWVLTNTVGSAVLGVVGAVGTARGELAIAIVCFVVGGVIFGGITGLVLNWLLRHPSQP